MNVNNDTLKKFGLEKLHMYQYIVEVKSVNAEKEVSYQISYTQKENGKI